MLYELWKWNFIVANKKSGKNTETQLEFSEEIKILKTSKQETIMD